MVDAFVQGMQAFPSRINPQSLHPISFNLLRELRLDFIAYKGAGAFVANKISRALQEIYKTQEDKFLTVMVELVTVNFLAARDARLGIEPVFRLIFLGALQAMTGLGFSGEKLQRMLEQMLMAMYMTPAYDFTVAHYQRLTYLTERLQGELIWLQKISKVPAPAVFPNVINGLREGLLNCFEVIDLNAVQKEELKAMTSRKYLAYIGLLDMVRDIWWFCPPRWFGKLMELKDKIPLK
jgi:hypothetical protein